MQSARYSCQIVTKFELSRQTFEKCSNIKFNQNPPNGSRVVPRKRKDKPTSGWTGITLRNSAKEPKIRTALGLDSILHGGCNKLLFVNVIRRQSCNKTRL